MANETILVLSGHGVAPYSARGLTQTLEPISAAGNNRRSINGELKDLSQPQFRKYHSTISATDQDPPAFDGTWQGVELTVDCVSELAFKTSGGSPQRTAVVWPGRVDGAFTFYRPRLEMRVVNFSQSQDEYGRSVNWSLELEEI